MVPRSCCSDLSWVVVLDHFNWIFKISLGGIIEFEVINEIVVLSQQKREEKIADSVQQINLLFCSCNLSTTSPGKCT